ncbi:MAG: epoxyqueuosine reductase QueH [Clostridiales bacterium]|nr:epoxyqueuosine reductase QueH [Clostridiales bacterium]
MKILMHMCCAPCAAYPSQKLLQDKHDVFGLFFNPNIHPIEEYQKRRDALIEFSKKTAIPIELIDGFMQSEWEMFSGTDDERCQMCYSIRLQLAAKYALDNKFDAYTTSLLVSPYQKHDLIKELGQKIGHNVGIPFYYEDFKTGYRAGQQRVKELGLYRQKYCGCIISYNNTILKKVQ